MWRSSLHQKDKADTEEQGRARVRLQTILRFGQGQDDGELEADEPPRPLLLAPLYEALSSLTYVLRPPLRKLLDSAVTVVGQQRLLLHKDFGEAGNTFSIGISLLVMIGAKKSTSECHHYAASVLQSLPDIW